MGFGELIAYAALGKEYMAYIGPLTEGTLRGLRFRVAELEAERAEAIAEAWCKGYSDGVFDKENK